MKKPTDFDKVLEWMQNSVRDYRSETEDDYDAMQYLIADANAVCHTSCTHDELEEAARVALGMEEE